MSRHNAQVRKPSRRPCPDGFGGTPGGQFFDFPAIHPATCQIGSSDTGFRVVKAGVACFDTSGQTVIAPQQSTTFNTEVVIRPPPDMTSVEQVRLLLNCCRQVIALSPRRAILLDLRDVVRADTKLIACLVVIVQLARRASVRIDLRGSRAVADLAAVCRLPWLVSGTASA